MDRPELIARVARLERINSTLWIALGLGAAAIAVLGVTAVSKTPRGVADPFAVALPAAPPRTPSDDEVEPASETGRDYQAIQRLYRRHLLSPRERDAKLRLLRDLDTAEAESPPEGARSGTRRPSEPIPAVVRRKLRGVDD